MIVKKRFKEIFTKWSAAIAVHCFIGISLSLPLQAQSPRPLPPTGSPDGSRSPGGTRPGENTNCPETEYPVTALVPETSSAATAVSQPTVWFYIPYAASDIAQSEFVVLDQADSQTLYRTSFPLPTSPGLISVSIEDYELEQDQSYHWYFTLSCVDSGNETTTMDITLDGWIQRTSKDPSYRWDGVWYDVLNETALQLQSNHDDVTLQRQWREMLEDDSINLEYLIEQPFLKPAD